MFVKRCLDYEGEKKVTYKGKKKIALFLNSRKDQGFSSLARLVLSKSSSNLILEDILNNFSIVWELLKYNSVVQGQE